MKGLECLLLFMLVSDRIHQILGLSITYLPKVITLSLSGSQAGTIIAFPIAGVICDSLGWEWVFYIQGTACLVWVIVWWIFVSDMPSTNRYITVEEIQYIESDQKTSTKPPPIPWKSLLSSMPFWAILVANFGNNWGFHLLLTELPIYMETILRLDINSNALLSALPYACKSVCKIST